MKKKNLLILAALLVVLALVIFGCNAITDNGADSTNDTDETTGVEETESDTKESTEFTIETTIDEVTLKDDTITVNGTTNLPDGAKVSVIPVVADSQSDYFEESMFDSEKVETTIKDGKFSTTHNANGYNGAEVAALFSFTNESGQPEDVIALVGDGGQNLTNKGIYIPGVEGFLYETRQAYPVE